MGDRQGEKRISLLVFVTAKKPNNRQRALAPSKDYENGLAVAVSPMDLSWQCVRGGQISVGLAGVWLEIPRTVGIAKQ